MPNSSLKFDLFLSWYVIRYLLDLFQLNLSIFIHLRGVVWTPKLQKKNTTLVLYRIVQSLNLVFDQSSLFGQKFKFTNIRSWHCVKHLENPATWTLSFFWIWFTNLTYFWIISPLCTNFIIVHISNFQIPYLIKFGSFQTPKFISTIFKNFRITCILSH